MIDITVWPRPIYEEGKDLTEARVPVEADARRRRSVHELPAASMRSSRRSEKPLTSTGEDSVMVGCIEPFKLAVVQSQ